MYDDIRSEVNFNENRKRVLTIPFCPRRPIIKNNKGDAKILKKKREVIRSLQFK